MSNAFLTITEFIDYHDERVIRELSGDRNNPDGDPARIQVLIDSSASRLESYLTGRYTLPLPSVPAYLKQIVADWAADRGFGRRENRPKGLDERLKEHREWLKDLMDGLIGLPGIDRAQEPRLVDSDFLDGRSRFDRVYGDVPSDTGPSRGE